MKRIPLLLAALGVVSAAAYAAPELTVTNFGQSIETENVSNGNDINDIWLWNTVGLKYDDWSYTLTAGKLWTANYDHDKEIESKNHRLQFDVSKKINDNLTLKGRYRGQNNFDRFQVGYDFNYGMLWSAGDFWYQFNDTANDNLETEWFPIGLKYGAFKVGYFINYSKTLGDTSLAGVKEDYIEHQIRAYAPLYNGERLSLSTEARVTISADESYEKPFAHREYDDFGRNRLYLKANYAVSENLNVFGTVGYEMRDWRLEDGKDDDHTEKYYSNFVIGYNYKF